MYEKTAMGIIPDDVNFVAGRDGRAVEKPHVNALNATNKIVYDTLLAHGQAIKQILLATILYDSNEFNHFTVLPEDSIDGIGKRRFSFDRRLGIQACQTVLQRLAKSGKAPWLLRVESDGSLSDNSGNAWGYCHSLNFNDADGIDDLSDILTQIRDASELLG